MAVCVAGAAPALALPPGIPAGGVMEFAIMRGGSDIGRHRLEFERRGEELNVRIAIDMEVKFAFLTVFRYSHRNHEVWRGNRLISLEATTSDDGRSFTVKATRRGDGLWVEGSSGSQLVPGDTKAATYWSASFLREGQKLINTQYGRVETIRVRPGATEIAAGGIPLRRFDVATPESDFSAWYGPDDGWRGLRFQARGSEITYVRLR
jgi:hypothetical protein